MVSRNSAWLVDMAVPSLSRSSGQNNHTESLGFLLLCKLQCCFCHLPRAGCQLLWEALFHSKAGVEGRWSDSGSFFPESILFLQLSRSLCTDRSLFPGQKSWRHALDICQFLIIFLTLYTLFS